jgi:tetratricopeptide (TPR) repeat protein
MIDVRHYAEASALLAQLLATEPSAHGWCLLARARLGEGDYAGVLDAANRAITLSPADGWPHRLASSALWNLRRYPESLRAALEARRLEPDRWQSHASVAQAGASSGNLQLAADAADEALRLAPEEPEVRYIAGRVSFALSAYQRAEAHQQRALTADPAHAGALNELGRLALEGHNPVRAVRMFTRAAAVAPESPVYARNVELAVIRSAALAIYAVAAAGGVVVMISAGLRLPMRLTMGSLAGTWIIVGCLLALAGRRIPAATRRVISRIARRRQVAVPIGIIAAGATIAVVSIPVIISTVGGVAGNSVAVPYLTPVIAIVFSRLAATAVWRDWRRTSR